MWLEKLNFKCFFLNKKTHSILLRIFSNRFLGEFFYLIINSLPKKHFLKPLPIICYFCHPKKRGARVVEGARLESGYTGNCIEGSNPFLSALFFLKRNTGKGFDLVY